jgi:hypothetical protein
VRVGAGNAPGALDNGRERNLCGRRELGRCEVAHLDGGVETVALPGHGLDPFDGGRYRSEHLAQGGDVHAEVHLFDHHVGPDRAEQFVLGQQMTSLADQRDQQIKRLARQRERLAVAKQQTFAGHQQEVAKAESRLLVGLHACL